MKRTISLALVLFLSCTVLTAWAQKADVKPASAKPTPTPNKKVVVKADSTYLRSKPDSKSKTVLSEPLTKFTPVEILGVEGKWTKVKTVAGKIGYIVSDTLAKSRFVSTSITQNRHVNLRTGPGMDNPIKVELVTNYPLIVLEKQGKRVKVADWEGDYGWAYETYISLKPFVIATPPGSLDWINLRDGPGLGKDGKPIFPKRFMAQKGTTFEVLAEKDGWLKVKHEDEDIGWTSAKIVWGWIDPVVVKLKKEKK